MKISRMNQPVTGRFVGRYDYVSYVLLGVTFLTILILAGYALVSGDYLVALIVLVPWLVFLFIPLYGVVDSESVTFVYLFRRVVALREEITSIQPIPRLGDRYNLQITCNIAGQVQKHNLPNGLGIKRFVQSLNALATHNRSVIHTSSLPRKVVKDGDGFRLKGAKRAVRGASADQRPQTTDHDSHHNRIEVHCYFKLPYALSPKPYA